MKILILNHEYPPLGGGGGVFTKDLIKEFVKHGIKVTLITSKGDQQKSIEKFKNLKIYRVFSWKRSNLNKSSALNLFFYIIFGFVQGFNLIFLKRKKFDYIYSHFALPAGLIGYLLAKIFKIRHVLNLHGADIYDPSKRLSGHNYKLTRFLIAKIINQALKTIASTKDIESKAYQYFKIKKKIKIIPLGFQPNQELNDLKKKIKKQNLKKLKLVTIGRLVLRKNLKLLIKALSRVNLENDFVLYLIGDGPERDNLKKYSRKLNLDKKIKFLGRLSDKEKFKYLIKSDVFISSALHEGFGIVFLEAMQVGLPIVASDSGGQIHFLKNKFNALFFKNNDLADLIKKIEKINQIKHDKDKYLKIKNNNLKTVKEFYMKNIAKKYIKLFNNNKQA
jgi:glycosyltransferase involved in cell wall biosynthesis